MRFFCHSHLLSTHFSVQSKFCKTSKFQENKKICPVLSTYFTPSCKTSRSSENNGYAVKYTQIVTYDLSISVVVIAFGASSKLNNTLAYFSCKLFFCQTKVKIFCRRCRPSETQSECKSSNALRKNFKKV